MKKQFNLHPPMQDKQFVHSPNSVNALHLPKYEYAPLKYYRFLSIK